MKLFVVSLIILTVIFGLCTFCTVVGTKNIDGMINTLSSAKTSGDKVPENAAKVCESLRDKWEKNSFLLSMFLPHNHLDEVKEKLVKLEAYANTDEFAEWKDATFVLKDELWHIRGLIGVSLDNVL